MSGQATAGTLYVPTDPAESPEDDSFAAALVEALYRSMREPVTDPSSAASVMPLVVCCTDLPTVVRCRWCRLNRIGDRCQHCGGPQ